MQVVAEEPWSWFLFDDNGRLYLEVLVEHGAISYSIAAALTAEQASDYAHSGVAFLVQLSGEMRGKALMREWCALTLPPDWAERSLSAVIEWQKRGNK